MVLISAATAATMLYAYGGAKKESFVGQQQGGGPNGNGPTQQGGGPNNGHDSGPNNHNDGSNNGQKNAGKTIEAISIAVIVSLILLFLVDIALAIFAVNLSWSSNSLIGWNTFAKVFFALVAFLNGASYLVIHLVNKLDLTTYVRKQNQRLAAATGPAQSNGGDGYRLGGGGRGSSRK